jgi:RNA polymerase subunit RPABC4/transcription elongation factor Spt4
MSVDHFSWPGGDWQTTLTYVLVPIVTYLIALWLTLVFWVYRDIRQRSRDPIVQIAAVLLVLVFNFPGHWLYLILRPRHTLVELYERSLEEEALLQDLEDLKACPTCRRRVHDEFVICPSCRTRLKEPCRSCSRPLSYAWVACPYCGLEKPAREAVSVRPGAAIPTASVPRPPAPVRPQKPPASRPLAAPVELPVTTAQANGGYARPQAPAPYVEEEGPVIGGAPEDDRYPTTRVSQ